MEVLSVWGRRVPSNDDAVGDDVETTSFSGCDDVTNHCLVRMTYFAARNYKSYLALPLARSDIGRRAHTNWGSS